MVQLTVEQVKVLKALAANRRKLSLVDCSAFETMLRLSIQAVFTFDKHFSEQGFDVIPYVFQIISRIQQRQNQDRKLS